MVTNHGKVFMNYNDNNDNLCSGYCDFAAPINQMILQIIMPLALVDKTNNDFKMPFLVNGHNRFKGVNILLLVIIKKYLPFPNFISILFIYFAYIDNIQCNTKVNFCEYTRHIRNIHFQILNKSHRYDLD